MVTRKLYIRTTVPPGLGPIELAEGVLVTNLNGSVDMVKPNIGSGSDMAFVCLPATCLRSISDLNTTFTRGLADTAPSIPKQNGFELVTSPFWLTYGRTKSRPRKGCWVRLLTMGRKPQQSANRLSWRTEAPIASLPGLPKLVAEQGVSMPAIHAVHGAGPKTSPRPLLPYLREMVESHAISMELVEEARMATCRFALESLA